MGFSKVVVESDFGNEELITADPVRSVSTSSPLRTVFAPTHVRAAQPQSSAADHHLTAVRKRGCDVHGLHAHVRSA